MCVKMQPASVHLDPSFPVLRAELKFYFKDKDYPSRALMYVILYVKKKED